MTLLKKNSSARSPGIFQDFPVTTMTGDWVSAFIPGALLFISLNIMSN